MLSVWLICNWYCPSVMESKLPTRTLTLPESGMINWSRLFLCRPSSEYSTSVPRNVYSTTSKSFERAWDRHWSVLGSLYH